MAWKENSNIHQEIIDGFDHIIQEKGNTYVSLRKVRWSENSDVKLDLRKYVTNTDGSEKMMKGCSFDEEGAHELTHVLTEEGYGDTRVILNNIKDRDDFKISMVRSLSDDDKDLVQNIFPDLKLPEPDEIDEEFYDIRSELGDDEEYGDD